MADTEPDVQRLRQGRNHRLEGCSIGVMNVFLLDGAPIAQLSVAAADGASDEVVRVRDGDELTAGSRTYRVVAVGLGGVGGEPGGFVDVALVHRRRRWPIPRLRSPDRT